MNIETISTVIIAIGALGWIGKYLIDLKRTPALNTRDGAEATSVGVDSLLKIVATLDERVYELERRAQVWQEIAHLRLVMLTSGTRDTGVAFANPEEELERLRALADLSKKEAPRQGGGTTERIDLL